MKTKTIFVKLFFITLIAIWGCGHKSHDQEGHDHDAMAGEAMESNGNEALYSEVMKIHDEVMPKMNEVYNLKQELTKKMTGTPSITADKKTEIEATISKLDSANDGMMIWMRQFNPLPDSLGEEKAREYLESEMEKVKKVRENITEALEKAKAVN